MHISCRKNVIEFCVVAQLRPASSSPYLSPTRVGIRPSAVTPMNKTDLGRVKNLSLCVIEESVVKRYSPLQERLIRSNGIAGIQASKV